MEAIRKSEDVPNWVRPDFQRERGEIERAIKEFLEENPNAERIQEIIKIFESAPLVELSDELWMSLENTDSFLNVRPGHIEDAEEINIKYNQTLSPENKRDFKILLD